MHIDIFGSCISRDPFELESNRYSVGKYMARSSFVSTIHGKKFDNKTEFDLGNNFRNRCLNDDLQKESVEYMETSDSPILLVDLIQERYGVHQYNEGLYTYSHDYRVSKLPIGKIIRYDEHFEMFKDQINKIANVLSNYEVVILHEANLTPVYYAKDQLLSKLAINDTDSYFMQNGSKYYNLFKEHVPNVYSLKINGYIGTELHKW